MIRPTLDESLSALDQLVLAELDSLAVGGARPRPTAAAVEGGAADEPRPRSARIAPLRTPRTAESRRSGEEAEGLFDASPSESDHLAAEGMDAGPAPSLLTAEEEAFITRAVGFLRQREHADMILARIWEQLTEGNPTGFFEAVGEPAPETEGDGDGPSRAVSRPGADGSPP